MKEDVPIACQALWADFLARLDRGPHPSGKTPGSRRFALGNILVASGQISRGQLERALARQSDTGRRLGEELIEAGVASRGQVEGGLLLQKRLLSCALTITVGLAPLAALLPSAQAAQARAALFVSVTVVPNAKIQAHYQAAQLQITAADVARGHVEVATASRFTVVTNSRRGYVMEFHPVGSVFASVHVDGLVDTVQLGADGGAIVQRGPLAAQQLHELSFRFNLNPDTKPGNYPWPLQLSAHAL